jgi:kynurenine formamidase
MKTSIGVGIALALVVAAPSTAWAQDTEKDVTNRSKRFVPTGPWPAGDERGMANAVGAGTWMRCGWYLSQPKAKVYEASHPRSNTMPLSPFSGPYAYKYNPTTVLPGTRHAFNMEYLTGGDPGQQGTQIDALGHFAVLPQAWDGKNASPADQAVYYGGYKQADVKPTPDSPLLKLGIDKAPPIVTSAVLLDAKTHLGKGQPMKPGELVTAKDIEAMLKAQGLGWRGLLPGDVLYVYTGWSDFWRDPDSEKFYYTKAPGLSYDAARYIGERRIVAVALDTPFVDPVNEGQLQGKAGPAAGTPQGLPFAVHHHMLTQMGIHHIENANLGEMARDKVWTSCTMILPLLEKGGAGSAVRPVAIGVPRSR